MKLSFSVSVLLLCCVCCVKAITIESCPSATASIIQAQSEETITLTCVTDAGLDPSNQIELQWYRNDDLVDLKEENRLHRSSLCVQPITKEENGVIFTCQLKGDASVNSSVELDVQFAPDLNDTEDILVEEESDVVLSCDVHANPAVTVAWKKDGEVLDLTTGSYKTTNNGITAQLSIPNIKRDVHQGTYICDVISLVFGTRNKSFKITVEDKTLKFPLEPMIAGLVVVACTIVLAIFARLDKIKKCCKRN
ncbi:transmembrane and immunoglobulin domain-containing protein 1 [Triplophysa rosa]|uniref:transmembrane and immunoglobulin domain-containing protein 1 n=1 Tax=Triplophysa rosa TaxID=992332 RepID=UPI002545C36F|nr:transmembrane and immunoglobulin domain-containing protein 1 [Triplophysa rosa]